MISAWIFMKPLMAGLNTFWNTARTAEARNKKNEGIKA